ncbi:MAG TPA: hypothetical protein PKK10_05230 [Woeseiaceae bacterium]|nr:hypothetical protein [Woeseiaceae bacterium]
MTFFFSLTQARTIGPVLAALWFLPCTVFGQTNAPFEGTEQSAYFDFWPGVWHEIVDGQPDPSATTFVVRRGVHPAAYVEEWTQVDDGIARKSFAIRAWDQINDRWQFTWISENALYQNWDTERVGDDWYIVKEWNIDGKVFLTRQAWIADGPNSLTRVFERSFDNRASWELVSKTKFQRVGDHK